MKVIIDGKEILISERKKIIQVLNDLNIEIPTLCYDKRFHNEEKCGICVVEINGEMKRACETEIEEGMNIISNSHKIVMERAKILSEIIEEHSNDCITCSKNATCKLKEYSQKYNIHSYLSRKNPNYKTEEKEKKIAIDNSNPFYQIDPNKCIGCGKCVAVCSKLQCVGQLELNKKSGKSIINVKGDKRVNDTNCVSCGNCVSVCPVAALTPKNKKLIDERNLKKIRSTCSYCGVGCQIDFYVKDNEIIEAFPADISPNKGMLCVKGKFGYKFVDHPDRLTKPLVRKEGVLVEVTYEEAYEYISKKMNEIKESYGSDAFAGLSSARCTNEDNFMFQKLFRGVLGTNNIDHCARL